MPSRPGSIRSVRAPDESTSEEDSGEDDEEEEEEEEHDTRSIRSFESMMSSRSNRRRRAPPNRKSITDRLASMPGLSRLSHNAPHDAARVGYFFVPYVLKLILSFLPSYHHQPHEGLHCLFLNRSKVALTLLVHLEWHLQSLSASLRRTPDFWNARRTTSRCPKLESFSGSTEDWWKSYELWVASTMNDNHLDFERYRIL